MQTWHKIAAQSHSLPYLNSDVVSLLRKEGRKGVGKKEKEGFEPYRGSGE